ncbi:hypothetical protein HDV04_005675 [Boothiomyces sp. JEL0838]|nr:hypothetical protein HDV04_005675 [Boothiomyces sp. JEL0838]
MISKFTIRQQPKKGKEAGLTKPYIKSQICPMPILQLDFQQELSKSELQAMNFLCNIVLIGEDDQTEHTLVGSVSAVKRYQENIFGSTIVQGVVLKDPEDGKLRIFFIFNDLYIKTPGKYRFRCQLINLNSIDITFHELDTAPFQIFKLKEYIKESTSTMLTRSFELQGIEFKTRRNKI